MSTTPAHHFEGTVTHVEVANPDDPHGMPAYGGSPTLAHHHLETGTYVAYCHTDAGEEGEAELIVEADPTGGRRSYVPVTEAQIAYRLMLEVQDGVSRAFRKPSTQRDLRLAGMTEEEVRPRLVARTFRRLAEDAGVTVGSVEADLPAHWSQDERIAARSGGGSHDWIGCHTFVDAYMVIAEHRLSVKYGPNLEGDLWTFATTGPRSDVPAN